MYNTAYPWLRDIIIRKPIFSAQLLIQFMGLSSKVKLHTQKRGKVKKVAPSQSIL